MENIGERRNYKTSFRKLEQQRKCFEKKKKKADNNYLETSRKEKRNSKHLKKFCQMKNRGFRITSLRNVGRKIIF